MTHLPLSGVLDAPTLHQMALPRCGTGDGESRAASAHRASAARRRRRTTQHGEHQRRGSRCGLGFWGAGSPTLPSCNWTPGDAAVGGRCSPVGTASIPGPTWALHRFIVKPLCFQLFCMAWCQQWLERRNSHSQGNSALRGGFTVLEGARTSPKQLSGHRGLGRSPGGMIRRAGAGTQ